MMTATSEVRLPPGGGVATKGFLVEGSSSAVARRSRARDVSTSLTCDADAADHYE